MISDFIKAGSYSAFVHFPLSFFAGDNIGIVKVISSSKTVWDYLVSFGSEKKILKVLKMVCFPLSLVNLSINSLAEVENMKIVLASFLLSSKPVLVFDNFFSCLIRKEQTYFMRLVRFLVNKKNLCVMLLERDTDFLVEYVKSVYLYLGKSKWEEVSFYDKRLYRYVLEPKTVSLINFLERNGYVLDHELTFNETLKAIYRGAK